MQRDACAHWKAVCEAATCPSFPQPCKSPHGEAFAWLRGRADRPGGLLMYGIPSMKLDKIEKVLRRITLLKQERATEGPCIREVALAKC